MGVDGYTEMARKLMDVTFALKQGIAAIPVRLAVSSLQILRFSCFSSRV